MNQNFLKSIEWGLIRGALIWAVACVCIGIAALVISYEYKESKEDTEEKYRLQLLSLNSKTNKAIRDGKTYDSYLPKFNNYIDKGYIGEQKRVLWVDILHNVTTSLRLPDMQYHISEQTEYKHKGKPLPEGSFSINKSVMQISMNLFHENDLFTILNTLNKESKSLYHIEQCSIRRSRPLDAEHLHEPNLSAQCDLVWIALQYPELTPNIENQKHDDDIM